MAVISGVVMEQYSNRPLANIPVNIGSVMTYTDGAGNFSVFVPDTGMASVSVSASGYSPYFTSMNVSSPNSLQIILSPMFRFM